MDGESRSLSGITTTFALSEGRKMSERNVTQDGYQEGIIESDTVPKATLELYRIQYITHRGADKSLARPGRKLFLSEWCEFPSAPCLTGKKKIDESSCLDI